MNSHDVLKKSIERIGAKRLAAELGMSTSAIYKWTQEVGKQGSGSINPLDRTLEICQQTKDTAPLQWLCQNMGGYFVSNSPVETDKVELDFLQSTQAMLAEFSDLLKTLSSSYEEDHLIDNMEAKNIRERWEALKSNAEKFVTQCENGDYNQHQRKI
jgi:transcriptional regulator with XRE-family HTH domain